MTQLKAYLKASHTTQAEFAERAGVSQAVVSQACRGSLGLTLRMVKRLVDASDGQVTAGDLYQSAVDRDAGANTNGGPANDIAS